MAIQKLNIPNKTDNAAKKKMVQSNTIGANETLMANEVNALVAKTNELVDATNNFTAITGFNFKENKSTYADLASIVDPQKDDAYGVLADGLIYIYNGTSWPTEGNGLDLKLRPTGQVAEGVQEAVSGRTVYDFVGPINEEVFLNNSSIIGVDTPSNGDALDSFNRYAVFMQKVNKGSLISNISYYYMGVSLMIPIKFAVFRKLTDGEISVGSEFQLIEEFITTVPISNGLNTFPVGYTVEEDAYIGFFTTANGFSKITGTPSEENALALLTSGYSVQAFFTASIPQVKIDITLRISKLNSVPELMEQIPDPSNGKIILMTGADEGTAWSDGKSWYWSKNNKPVDVEPFNFVGELIRRGFNSLFDFSTSRYMNLTGDDINEISDAIGEIGTLSVISSSKPIFDGNKSIFSANSLAADKTLDIPIYVTCAFRYTGDGTGQSFLFDGSTVSNRLALYVNNGHFNLFTNQNYQLVPWDNDTHVIGIEVRNGYGRVYWDGVYLTTLFYPSTEVRMLKIGSDYAGARNWIGEIYDFSVRNGVVGYDTISSVNILQMTRYSVNKRERTPLSSSHSTVGINDGLMLSKNGNEIINIASLAKLMTSVIIEELGVDLMDVVTIVESDVVNSNITNFVQEGDQVTVYDLLNASIIVSDNNSANTLARVGGYAINPSAGSDADARSSFYSAMNAKATLLGMTNTTYNLSWTNCYSTSNDQCKLLLHIHHYCPLLISYWGEMSYEMVIGGVNPRTYTISSTTSAIARAIIPEFVGGKTGTVNYQGFYAFVWEHLGKTYATTVCGVQPDNMRFGETRNIIDSFINNYSLFNT